jgi:hypothetical protein
MVLQWHLRPTELEQAMEPMQERKAVNYVESQSSSVGYVFSMIVTDYYISV